MKTAPRAQITGQNLTLQRIVYAVLVMQLALFVLLFQQQSKTQAAIKAFTDHTQVAHTDKFKTAPAKVSDHQPTIIKSELNAVDVRLIIQEELEFFTDEIKSSLRAGQSNLSAPPPVLSDSELQFHQANLAAQMSKMTASGQGSAAEISAFEETIAKLPPEERIKALGELNRAINSGAIDTKF